MIYGNTDDKTKKENVHKGLIKQILKKIRNKDDMIKNTSESLIF